MTSEYLKMRTKNSASLARLRESKDTAIPGFTRIVALPITGASTLFSTHLVIDSLGAQNYAFIILIATMTLLIPFADLGVGAFVTNIVAEPNHSPEAVARALTSAFRVLTLSALAITAAAWAVAAAGFWDQILGIRSTGGLNVNLTVPTVLTIFAIGLPLSISQRVLIGLGKNSLLIVVQAFAPVATLLGLVICRDFAAPAELYAAMWPAGMLISLAVSTALCATDRRFSPFSIVSKSFKKNEPKTYKIWHTAAPMLVTMIMLPLAHQSGRLVLSHRGQISSLANYSIVATLYLPILSVLSAMAQVLWRKFAIHGRWTVENLIDVRTYVVYFTGIGMALGITLVVAGPFVVSIVSSQQLDPQAAVYVSFALLLVAQAVQLPMGMLLTDSNGLRLQAVCSILTFTVTIMLAWIITPQLGAVGPVLAIAIAVSVCQCGPYSIYCFRRYKELSRDQQSGVMADG